MVKKRKQNFPPQLLHLVEKGIHSSWRYPQPNILHFQMNQCEFNCEAAAVNCVDVLLAQSLLTFLLLCLILLTSFAVLADKQLVAYRIKQQMVCAIQSTSSTVKCYFSALTLSSSPFGARMEMRINTNVQSSAHTEKQADTKRSEKWELQGRQKICLRSSSSSVLSGEARLNLESLIWANEKLILLNILKKFFLLQTYLQNCPY